MLDVLTPRYGAIAPIDEPASSAPAERYALADGTTFGIIASTTDPFCGSCDRSRLTADGMWYLCLYATRGLDLRAPLRAGVSRDELQALITARLDRARRQRRARIVWRSAIAAPSCRCRICYGRTRTSKCTREAGNA